MKSTLRTLVFLLLPTCLPAQIEQWFFDFDLVELPCPFDSSINISQPTGWLVYQTLDGTWNGTVDSSKCIEMEPLGTFSARVKLNQIDPTKPLFLRRRFLGAPDNLMLSNMLYRSASNISTSSGLQIKTGTDCPDELCTGLMTIIEIPDEDGTGKAQRIHRTAATWSSSQSHLNVDVCLPTEKFDENFLDEAILKITPNSSNLASHHLTFSFFDLASPDMIWNFISTVSYITALPQHFNGTTYDLNINESANNPTGWSDGGYLFLYTASTYPSMANYSYVEAQPSPNSPEHQTINVEVEWYQSAIFQPFVQLRGALLAGNDSLRHTVNLINNGGDFCFSSFIDLIFENDVNFLYLNGQVNFAEANSCMMFRNGGSLKVGDGATFHYGHDGVGMLGLGSGGSIELGKNGKLVVDNRVMLTSFLDDPNQEIAVELNPGNALVFGENASMFLSPWSARPVQLIAYMNGGELDDSQLSAEERQLIRRIYPPQPGGLAQNVEVSPKPVAGLAKVKLNLGQAQNLSLQIWDLQGRLVRSEEQDFEKGEQPWEMDLSDLPGGAYFLRIKGGEGVFFQKMLVQ